MSLSQGFCIFMYAFLFSRVCSASIQANTSALTPPEEIQSHVRKGFRVAKPQDKAKAQNKEGHPEFPWSEAEVKAKRNAEEETKDLTKSEVEPQGITETSDVERNAERNAERSAEQQASKPTVPSPSLRGQSTMLKPPMSYLGQRGLMYHAQRTPARVDQPAQSVGPVSHSSISTSHPTSPDQPAHPAQPEHPPFIQGKIYPLPLPVRVLALPCFLALGFLAWMAIIRSARAATDKDEQDLAAFKERLLSPQSGSMVVTVEQPGVKDDIIKQTAVGAKKQPVVGAIFSMEAAQDIERRSREESESNLDFSQYEKPVEAFSMGAAQILQANLSNMQSTTESSATSDSGSTDEPTSPVRDSFFGSGSEANSEDQPVLEVKGRKPPPLGSQSGEVSSGRSAKPMPSVGAMANSTSQLYVSKQLRTTNEMARQSSVPAVMLKDTVPASPRIRTLESSIPASPRVFKNQQVSPRFAQPSRMLSSELFVPSRSVAPQSPRTQVTPPVARPVQYWEHSVIGRQGAQASPVPLSRGAANPLAPYPALRSALRRAQ